MKHNLNSLVRENIKNLQPYSAARHEFTGIASIFLDANENAYGSPTDEKYNRYPDPLQLELKTAIAKIKGVKTENIFIGNGSDEVIDIAYRTFCTPQKDNVIICPPTYGMYKVSANINDVAIKTVNLTTDFQLNTEGIIRETDSNTKLLFICSPNNPTGNNMNRADIIYLLENFSGIIIIDEAYINFSKQNSFIEELSAYPNLIVMQTLSKAWGLAALRVGICFASEAIINIFNKVKPPYNINEASQQIALQALQNTEKVNNWVEEINIEKEILTTELLQFTFVKKIYPSNANFILVKMEDGDDVYQHLTKNEIVVRNRNKELQCENCLRITIGTKIENEKLISTLKKYSK